MYKLLNFNRYSVFWYGLSFTKRGRKHYHKKRKIIHAENLTAAKDRALQLFGEKPDGIRQI
jgi:hypothetical protein